MTFELFDTHCHLQAKRLIARFDDIVARATASGVTRLLCCGTCEADWPLVEELAGRSKHVVPAFGIHPWYMHDLAPGWRDRLATTLLRHPGAAVGEIGLDHAVDPDQHEAQEELFREQLSLAAELARPVTMHCRRAWQSLLHVLAAMPPLPRGFAIHSFSGSPEMIPALVARGAYFSFSGSLTLSGNKRSQKSAAAVPADRLLIETDAPDLIPVINGERDIEAANEPANLVYVLRRMAEVRGLPEDETAALTTKNALRLFGGAP